MKHSLLCLALLLTSLLAAQPYRFTQYTVGDGLPQSQVYAVLQDSRGYLWLGTQGGGLAKFDGRSFRNYSTKDRLRGNYVNALAEDPQGMLWIGTDRGLCRFNGRKFGFDELKHGQDIAVNSLAFRQSNDSTILFIASQNGAYSFVTSPQTGCKSCNSKHILNRPRQLEAADVQPFGRLTATFCDSKNQVWMGGDDGLFKLENGQWQTIQRRKAEVMAIAETTDGRILAGIFNSGILILEGKKRSYLNTQNGLPSNKVQCLWRNPHDGKIWIGLQDAGICIWDATTGRVERITEDQGLCSRNIRSIVGDKSGKVVWLGTSGGGVCKYSTQRFEHFDMGDGLRSNFVYAVCEAKNNRGRWFSAGDRGISYWGPASDSSQATVFRHFDGSNGFYNVKCRALHRDFNDRIWVGTEGMGLAVLDEQAGGAFQFFYKRNGLAGNWIRDIVQDPTGAIWVATTDGGVSKMTFAGGSLATPKFRNFGLADGLHDLTVHALHVDKKGRVWFASQTGEVGFIENEKLSLLGLGDGLPGSTARCLTEDEHGHLWVGTAGGGIAFADIYKSKSLKFKQLGLTDTLASANVYLLHADKAGLLWVGSERGVDRIHLDSTGRFLKVKYFGLAEGFLGMETCQNAVTTGPDLWFGTMNGLMHYLPATDNSLGGAPLPVLTGVRLFYEPLESSPMSRWSDIKGGLVDGAVFPHHQNHLGFEFFATDFLNQERVMYSWQLVGQEADWSPFSTRTEVSYANLPPNDYRFQLRARNEDGIISQPTVVSFSIKPPFWQTWWFRLSALGGFLLLVLGVFKWRVNQVKQKAALEKEQLELQNRLLTLEQKSRQLQMNPHFIFNALNGIQGLVSSGNMDSARQHILKFGRLMRAVLDNSRQPLIPLDKEVETLRNYLELEQFCREGKFDFELDTTGIESPDLQVPPMLLQPFVENAILHGIGPLSGKKGLISLVFTEKQDLLEVAIRDNGIGIEQSQARKTGQEAERQLVG
ncbi:MAG: histidine kinase, partial [Saprospiraceae bacterium]|nr:histidine kinase [Saprospiraceae bacterium]